ncbi:MAG: ABC transporter permease [Myxococcales bacterium]|nr:ABC transporter permease [Myxococcales bacterium]
MKAYLVKRLLLMIPTFLGITLLVFAVLNLAPGRPGAAQKGAESATDPGAEATAESYRIFREQFHLDKPVLLNTLFALDEAEVRDALEVVIGRASRDAAERVAASERLDDYGRYAVPHLVAVLAEADRAGDARMRDAAVAFLRRAAPRPLVDPFDPHPPERVRERNREIDAENAYLRSLRYDAGAPEAEASRIAGLWQQWYGDHAERWRTSTGERLRILLLDTRFAAYCRNLARLDFGVSLVTKEPVLATLVAKLPYSLTLSVGSLLLAYAIAIPLGILSAVSKDSPLDRATTVVLFMLYSLPSFFVATLLLALLSTASQYEWLRLFPTGGFRSRDYMDLTSLGQLRDVAHHMVLPMFCATYGSLASLSRYMRTGLLDVIRSDYVRTARAKGLPEIVVIGRHAVRNGLLPILTLLAGLLPAALGGAVIIEYIFGIPGMGLWIVDSIFARDYNAIMVVQLFSTLLVLVGILLTDLSYALVDPRIRFE